MCWSVLDQVVVIQITEGTFRMMQSLMCCGAQSQMTKTLGMRVLATIVWTSTGLLMAKWIKCWTIALEVPHCAAGAFLDLSLQGALSPTPEMILSVWWS